ncbi:Xanthine phosphoribosyltransferase 1 [Entomortierella beljakovae]|nr:Xanthine phosphoribosyltransferase 1 [Entomortierella beljakovae]
MTNSTRHLFATPPAWFENWIKSQELDPALNETEGYNLAVDVVYTWVNGSDPKLRALKEEYQKTSPFFLSVQPYIASRNNVPVDQTANRFRDMSELRYSVRSVFENAGDLFDRIHILTTRDDDQTKESQVPSWLDLSKAGDVVRLVPHDTVFDNPPVLPSFNSLSIESQIHHIPDLTDVYLYLNDDVFLGTRMQPADVWTPIYGFVFHMEPTLLVPPTILELQRYTLVVGEWNSLQYSNYLLSKQFGQRHRAYLAHVPHVLSKPILQEIQSIWSTEFNETSSHRFRGDGEGKDIQVSFFMAHYVQERLRETQLNSYWFNRLDANQDGALDWSEREFLIKKIEQWNKDQQNNVFGYGRSSKFEGYLKNHKETLDRLAFPASGSSDYRLSGLDGYPFMIRNVETSFPSSLKTGPVYMAGDETKVRTCQFDINFCFGTEFNNTSINKLDAAASGDIFHRMAFTEFHCGDCLLHILRQTASEPGLGSEILPLDKESDKYKDVTLDLAKYNYVVATSAYSFIQLQEPRASETSLSQILSSKDTEAFFCINDNIGDNPQTIASVRQVFKNFLDERFPKSSPWEKQ